MKLRHTIGLAAGLLTLGSIAALAQMNMPDGPMHNMHSQMQERMMQRHSQMQHGPGMNHGSHGQHQGGAQPKGDTSPSSLAFQAINQKMHDGMNITFSGNADVDFVRGMIPHHQGAVDMAKTVIAFGKDPQVRKLAEEIIKAQETEIALMQEWLKKNAK
jgi:uncharacterized protein (DUF305 family)